MRWFSFAFRASIPPKWTLWLAIFSMQLDLRENYFFAITDDTIKLSSDLKQDTNWKRISTLEEITHERTTSPPTRSSVFLNKLDSTKWKTNTFEDNISIESNISSDIAFGCMQFSKNHQYTPTYNSNERFVAASMHNVQYTLPAYNRSCKKTRFSILACKFSIVNTNSQRKDSKYLKAYRMGTRVLILMHFRFRRRAYLLPMHIHMIKELENLINRRISDRCHLFG